ncbi:KxYKxGKxW signal peptide domain-containing protein [Oenococcus oeni]
MYKSGKNWVIASAFFATTLFFPIQSMPMLKIQPQNRIS